MKIRTITEEELDQFTNLGIKAVQKKKRYIHEGEKLIGLIVPQKMNESYGAIKNMGLIFYKIY